jgi:hypothetical protein
VSWRRVIFHAVWIVTFLPLWLMFVIGFTAEALMQAIERLDDWSRDDDSL